MTTPNDDGAPGGPDELARLLDAVLDGSSDPSQADRLAELLRQDAGAVEAYVDQVRMHAMLRWRHGRAGPVAGGALRIATASAPSAGGERVGGWRRWAVAAAVLFAASLTMTLILMSRREPSKLDVQTVALGDIAELREVVWADGQRPLAAGDVLRGGDLAIRAGTLHLRLKSDVVVALSGPGKMRVLSETRVRALAGRVTARVGPAGKGFTVEAPAGEVIDLGTEFGVQVDDAGRTDVLVFDGQVDLVRKAAAQAPVAAPTRIRKGEGLHVAVDGQLARVVSVEGAPGGPDWSLGSSAGGGTIASVRDNLRGSGSPKFYRIVRGGLTEDAPAYVDRCYEWNGVDAALGLPAELRGADLVMTFNSDKRTPDLALTVTLARPAALYVFHEPRKDEVPEWLRRDFVNTGLTVGLDEGRPDMPQLQLGRGAGQSVDRVFSVWRREVRAAGPVVLGENSVSAKSMYGIAAAPLP